MLSYSLWVFVMNSAGLQAKTICFAMFISSTCLAHSHALPLALPLPSCDSTPSVLDVCEFREGEKKELMTCIKHRLTPQPSKIRAGKSQQPCLLLQYSTISFVFVSKIRSLGLTVCGCCVFFGTCSLFMPYRSWSLLLWLRRDWCCQGGPGCWAA